MLRTLYFKIKIVQQRLCADSTVIQSIQRKNGKHNDRKSGAPIPLIPMFSRNDAEAIEACQKNDLDRKLQRTRKTVISAIQPTDENADENDHCTDDLNRADKPSLFFILFHSRSSSSCAGRNYRTCPPPRI